MCEFLMLMVLLILVFSLAGVCVWVHNTIKSALELKKYNKHLDKQDKDSVELKKD